MKQIGDGARPLERLTRNNSRMSTLFYVLIYCRGSAYGTLLGTHYGFLYVFCVNYFFILSFCLVRSKKITFAHYSYHRWFWEHDSCQPSCIHRTGGRFSGFKHLDTSTQCKCRKHCLHLMPKMQICIICPYQSAHTSPPPIPTSAQRVSTECVCLVSAECLPSSHRVWALGKHSAGTRQTKSVDNTQWKLAEHSVGLVVYYRGWQ